MGSAAAYARTLVRQAEALLLFEEVWDTYYGEDITITQIRVIHPGIAGGEYKAVIKARIGETQVVAFHNATTLLELLVGIVNRLQNRSLKFREDQYAS
jgi:hypothetical protein